MRHSTGHEIAGCAAQQRIGHGDEGKRNSRQRWKCGSSSAEASKSPHTTTDVARRQVDDEQRAHIGHFEEFERDRDLVREEAKHFRDKCGRTEISVRPFLTEVQTLSKQLQAVRDSSAEAAVFFRISEICQNFRDSLTKETVLSLTVIKHAKTSKRKAIHGEAQLCNLNRMRHTPRVSFWIISE